MSRPQAGNVWSNNAKPSAPVRTGVIPYESVQQLTREQEEQQNAMLDKMSTHLSNIKSSGTAIQDEATLHIKLLDNLEDTVRGGDASLQRETARTKWVIKTSQTCGLYIVICALLAVLIILIVIKVT